MSQLVLLDRDGVLNCDLPKGVCSPEEFEWLPGAIEAVVQLTQAGFSVAVVTNQSAVSKGWLSEADLEVIHARLRQEVADAGGKIDAIYACTDHPNAPTHRRKPNAGMLEEALADFAADPTETPAVGDALRDLQAAKAVGCPRYLVRTGKGEALWQAGIPEELLPVTVCDSVLDAVAHICAYFG